MERGGNHKDEEEGEGKGGRKEEQEGEGGRKGKQGVIVLWLVVPLGSVQPTQSHFPDSKNLIPRFSLPISSIPKKKKKVPRAASVILILHKHSL